MSVTAESSFDIQRLRCMWIVLLLSLSSIAQRSVSSATSARPRPRPAHDVAAWCCQFSYKEIVGIWEVFDWTVAWKLAPLLSLSTGNWCLEQMAESLV